MKSEEKVKSWIHVMVVSVWGYFLLTNYYVITDPHYQSIITDISKLRLAMLISAFICPIWISVAVVMVVDGFAELLNKEKK